MTRLWWRILCASCLLLVHAGCEMSQGDASAGGPVKVCERAGQQCRYAKGKLGVCQFDAGQKLACMSQH